MNVPTLDDLRQSVLNDLRNRLEISTIIGKFFLNVFALVQAGKLKLIYLTAAFVYRNNFPDTADPASLGGTLERFGFVKLERYPAPPTAGEYQVQVSGTIGATIDANTTLKSLDTSTSPGKIFVIDSSVTFASATELVTIRALEAGTDSELQINDQLQFTQPIDNVDSFAEVTSVVTSPTSGETIEEYRQAVLNSYRIESQGGAKGDYVLWADDVAAVRKIYPYTTEPGKITIYVEATEADSTDGKGTPSNQTLTDVKNAVIADPETGEDRAPMGIPDANIITSAITIIDIDVEITNLSDTGLLSDIETNMQDFLKDIRPFRDGVDNPQNRNEDKLYLADIYDIVRNVTGTSATFDKVVMKVSGSAVDVREFLDGDIPYLDSVTNV
jgi:uncharacterized phage protein gp47/JayE